MRINVNRILSSCCLVLFFAKIGDSVRCFQCNSINDPECTWLKSNDTQSLFYKECSTDTPDHVAPFCRKSVIKVTMKFQAGGPHTRVIRACGFKKDQKDRGCYKKSDKDHDEEHCQCFSDGCNGATTFTKLPIIGTLFAVFFILKAV